MKTLLITLTLVVSININAQNKLDSLYIENICKNLVYNEIQKQIYQSTNELAYEISTELVYNLIRNNQIGLYYLFSDLFKFTFLEVFVKVDTIKELGVICHNCKRFVIAISSSDTSTFNLKGFQKNDFPDFIKYIQQYKVYEISKVEEFIKSAYIEGLDLNCLYNYYYCNQAHCSCLNYCSFSKLNYHKYTQ